MEVKNNSLSLKNYILLGNTEHRKKQAEKLVSEAEKQFPQCSAGISKE